MNQTTKTYYMVFGEEFMPRGIYTDWTLASKAMKGVKQRFAEDKYRKCSSEEEYKSFLKEKNLELPIIETKKDFKAQVIEQHGSLELVDWEIPIDDALFNEFKKYGYDEVSMNLWNDNILYVNIKGLPTISFDLGNKYNGRKSRCKINIAEMIDRDTFKNLVSISKFITRNKYKIKRLLKNNKTISNKKSK